MKNFSNSSQPPLTPLLAVDGIIKYNGGIVVIERKNEPF